MELSGDKILATGLLQKLIGAGVNVVFFDSRGPGLEQRYREAFEPGRAGGSKGTPQ